MKEKQNKQMGCIAIIVKSLLIAYAVTAILLMVLALLLYKMNLTQNTVEIGILLVYLVCAFGGGFAGGKMAKSRRFVWGIVIGAAYVLVMLVVSFAINGKISGSIGADMITLVMCMAVGMLGGMLS